MRLAWILALLLVGCTTVSPELGDAESVGDTASVLEVVDGDTLVVDVDGVRESVRLIGINAPEREACVYQEATDRLADLVAEGEVLLVQDVSERDEFGRLLRYVLVGAADAGEQLVEEGLAVARRYPPDLARVEEYEAAEDAARGAGVGLWADDPCGAGDTPLEILDVSANAPGDDAANPNGEWVEIVNSSEEVISLEGWGIADESSRHRFTFPAGASIGPGEVVRVRSGCGERSAGTFHWCADGAVWKNGGDTAFLTDPDGALVDTFPYP